MHISLATGLGSGPRRRGGPPQPADESPRLLRAPALVGTGRIGATLTVDPGVWADARDLAFAWLRDGAPIPGATGPVYAPVPADDRAALACRVAALNAAGRTTADTPAVAAAFPPPLPLGPIPDLILTQGTGPHHVDISSFFSGESLRFSVTGEGVVIDPATGVTTVSAEALLSGVSLLVAAENSGGRAELRFGLKVAPAFVAPAPTTLPALLGGGRVGEPLGVTPGVWSGDPAPELTLQWLRGGVPVAGATGDRYVPGAAEDGLAVACRVTARNVAGEAAAETEAVTVTQVPPVAAGALADVVLAQGPGGRTLPAAGTFAGAALRFSVTGAGAEIDPATGVVTIPTATARAAEAVTVTAANSGGEAHVRFAVTVMAAPAAAGTPQPAVFAVAPGSRGVATQGLFTGPSLVYALEGAPAGVTINAGSGLVTVPTGTALQASFTVAASNVAGAARRSFAVTVRAMATSFAAAAALAEVPFRFVAAAPAWTHNATGGFGRLVPAASDRAHGAWALSQGDGRYRCLARWGLGGVTPVEARPFGLIGRMTQSGANFLGVRAELVLRSTGARVLELRQYTGVGTGSTTLAAVPLAWAWDVWHWLEMEVEGAAVRARLYPEAGPVPAWQATAATTHVAAGAFGPSAFAVGTQRPALDIRRLEFQPLQSATAPAAASAGDWTLGQTTVQS